MVRFSNRRSAYHLDVFDNEPEVVIVGDISEVLNWVKNNYPVPATHYVSGVELDAKAREIHVEMYIDDTKVTAALPAVVLADWGVVSYREVEAYVAL